MKNLYITLFLSILGLSGQLNAQTLKNIHRHNQPVLRIPTHLIDKVETADVQGTPHLRVIQFNGYVSEIPLSQIDSITHSEGQAVDPAQLGNLRTASVMGVVTGPTGAPEMNAIVRSPYGGEETRTDPNGVFFLNNILVYDKLGYITITKPGFHQGSRSFLPLETGSNRVNVQLLPMTQSGSFNAINGGTVTSGLLQLNFPANAVTLNGQPYNGTVRVYAAALDPTSPSMYDQMPGELLGGMNDSLQLLRSFGMASVELRDANMNELQLANGLSATLTFNIPSALQAEAPATIDWWSFDEAQGIWMHEGMAQKQGTQYIGQASHFSWWNLDIPGTFNVLLGNIATTSADPASNAKIELISPSFGTVITYTNANGLFGSRIPKNEILTLNINLICNTSNDWALADSESIISEESNISADFTVELSEYFPVSGVVVNCQGQPVESGYVQMGAQISFTAGAAFVIQTCALGENILRAFDISYADSIIASYFDTLVVPSEGIDIGNIQACLQFSSTITDVDGNIYSTVLIGNQLWMSENLRTATYANGEEIADLTDGGALWSFLTSGAWCYYDDNVFNDGAYGKLYNWFTTIDPRGLCPAGWHVPTDEDWTVLTDFLGGQSVAGGKMKSVNGWNPPNTNATNESGFSGLPGGFRDAAGMGNSFLSVGNYGFWWSSTESSAGNALIRELRHTSDNSYRIDYFSQNNGFSVRCLMD